MADYGSPGAGSAAPAAHVTSHISGGSDPFTSAQLIEALCKRLRESGGADLALGAIADGEFLKRSGTSCIGGTAASIVTAALGGSLVLVEHKLITSTQTTVTFSGLAGDTDKLYLLVYSLKAAAATLLDVRPNGLTTNQYGQIFQAGAASLSGASNTAWRTAGGSLPAGAECFGFALIGASKLRNGVARIRHFLSLTGGETTDGSVEWGWVQWAVWNETATELTSLDLVGSANAIGDGSTFTLYKLKEA